MDILATIEEQRSLDIKKLAKRLKMQLEPVEEIMEDLKRHNLVEYEAETGKISLPKWITEINKEIEKVKPASAAVILPKAQEIKIEDVTIGNYTEEDLELRIRLKANRKEIAICSTN
ncbi:MAG: hypothetical protein ACUVUE_06665 [Candidatus Bathycorpusculaceae bacterium]